MATPGGLVDKTELINAQLDTAHLGRVVNSKDASGNPISESTNRTGGVNKTLDALEAAYTLTVINLPSGQWSSGVDFNARNEIMYFNGTAYKLDPATNLPYTTQGNDPTVLPDLGAVIPVPRSELGSSDYVASSTANMIGGISGTPDNPVPIVKAVGQFWKVQGESGVFTNYLIVNTPADVDLGGGLWAEKLDVDSNLLAEQVTRNNSQDSLIQQNTDKNESQDLGIQANLQKNNEQDTRLDNAESNISALQAGQGSGVYGYTTRANLEADLTPPDGAIGLVTNDPTATNNTNYIKSGASGTGSWTQGDDTLAAQAYQQSLESETYLEKNERIYDLKNRVKFVSGEINDPQYAPDLSPRPALDYSVVNGELVLTGTGASSLPSVWWLGHRRKLDKNTEIIMRITLNEDYAGGSSAGPGPMIYFGDSSLRGYLYSESGYIFGFDGNRSGQGTYGQTPQDTLAQFGQGEEVELRVVLRSDGTGFAIGKKLSNGYELRLNLDESNLSTFQEGKIWVAYNRDTAQTITHFEVNELEVIPEDFNQEDVLSDISSLEQRVELLEQSVGEKLIPYAMPEGFSMYQELGFEILRGMRTKAFYTTFNPLGHLIATSNSFWVDKDNGNDSNNGSESSPFATFAKAITEANTVGASTINVLGGEYDYQDTGVIPQITVDVNIIGNSPTLRPEITTASTESGWTIDPSFPNLWTLTVSGDAPVNCYDRATIDEFGGYSGLVLRTQSEANDTPGSFYVSGNTIWIRTHDSRQPDSDFRVVRDLPMLDFSNELFYIQDMIFRGGNTYTAVAPDNRAGTCVTNNCSFTNGRDQSFRWIRSSGTSRIIHYKSEAAWSRIFDGFSYTSAGSGTDAIEIECFGHHCGIEEGSTHNGSTIHTATRMIRVNCHHYYNWNKNVADVSNSSQSLNLGVFSGTTGDNQANSSVNFNVDTGAEMWLDSCVSDGGSITDFDVGAGSTMRIRNTDTYQKSIVEDGVLEQF